MKTIILAAGQGYNLGGFNKVLLKNPINGLSIMDFYLDIFSETEITVVVGFNATNIMNQYPKLNYIFNQDWHLTKDSYSLALALNEEPCYIVHSDIFMSNNVRSYLDNCEGNCAIGISNADRSSSAINSRVESNVIKQVYQGELYTPYDPELIGVYKVTDSDTLLNWKRNCLEHKSLLIGQNYPFHKDLPFYMVNGEGLDIYKIKTPVDYINYLNNKKNSAI
jgi:choline kinase